MELLSNLVHGIGWAVLVMMFDFAISKDRLFNWYYLLISKLKEKAEWLFKILGGCPVCFGLWFSYPAFYVIGGDGFFYFLIASQFVLILRYVNNN